MLKAIFNEFKKFSLRGNVLDLAIGVIIGGAFGTIVNSLVQDIMMPPIGVLLSVSHAQDFQDWCLPINADKEHFELAQSNKYASEHKIAAINYGRFINNVLSFLIISFSVFLVVKQVNRIVPAAAKTRDCPICFSTISTKARRCPACTSEIEPTVK